MILYRAEVLTSVTRELIKYRMDLVWVQEVRWEDSGTLQSGNYTLFYGEGNASHQLATGFLFTGRLGQQFKWWTLTVTVFLVLR